MTLRIGRVAVYISYPFAAMMALILLLDTESIAVAGLLAALIHEVGHLIWMVAGKVGIQRISCTLSGIHIQTAGTLISSYKNEAILALTGPLMNLLAAVLLMLLPHSGFSERLMLTNLALMGLNILPIQALDGGSALEALLCMFTSREKAEKITFIVSVICLIPLVVFGFMFVLRSRYNFTLLILALFLIYNIAIYSKERRIL